MHPAQASDNVVWQPPNTGGWSGGFSMGIGTYTIAVKILKDTTIYESRPTKDDACARAREILMDGIKNVQFVNGNRTTFYPPHRIKQIDVYPAQYQTITTTPYAQSYINALADEVNKKIADEVNKHSVMQNGAQLTKGVTP